ncbi:hypothetical protein SAMN05443144_101140 [Fodinibius roseus]|uniref:Uncharacterized protein n=1 Tax=Fodinibius roseus TaxID=1194090 RepID=A0A1M4SWI0_9BACT|nr:hypothetical protein SAMN05443144_101140 [Fodinibius roseus]
MKPTELNSSHYIYLCEKSQSEIERIHSLGLRALKNQEFCSIPTPDRCQNRGVYKPAGEDFETAKMQESGKTTVLQRLLGFFIKGNSEGDVQQERRSGTGKEGKDKQKPHDGRADPEVFGQASAYPGQFFVGAGLI